jgi:hypothetical protein
MPSVSKKQHNLMAMVANDPKAAKRLGIPQSVGEEFMKADKKRGFGAGKAMTKKPVKKMQAGGVPTKPAEMREPMRGRSPTPMAPGSAAFMTRLPAPSDYYRIPNPLSRAGIGPQVVTIAKPYTQQTGRQAMASRGVPFDPRASFFPVSMGREEAARMYPNPRYNVAYDPRFEGRDELEEAERKHAEFVAARGETKLRAGGPIKGYKRGGQIGKPSRKATDGAASKDMADKMGRALKKKAGAGRAMMKYAEGGSVFRKGADGVAHKGKTKAKMVKMRMGGKC